MKVLMCFPPPEEGLRVPKGGNFGDWYGVGPSYLQSYLEQHGHQTEAHLDYYACWDEYHHELMRLIYMFEPDYIAVQVYSMNRINAYNIANICKEHNIKCVFGGVHASALPQQTLDHYPWIQVVVGEGERALLDIVEGCEDRIVQRPLIEDLDTIPFPKHEYFFRIRPERKMACIITSRGCPFSCSFCCLPNISYRRLRKRSVESVIEEIVQLKKEYPQIEGISFQDEAFTLDSKRVIQICDRLIELDLGLLFSMAGTVKGNTEEMFKKMELAGLEHLYVGLETGNQEVLDRANKKLKLEEVERLFYNSRKYPKVIISLYLITGLPGETWESVKDTVKFIKKLQKIRYAFVDFSTIIWVFPGTQIYEIAKEKGVVDDEYWFTDGDSPNYTGEHNMQELVDMQQYVLNRISFTRIFTPLCFFHQMTNSPIEVLKFAWYHKRFVKFALGESLGYMFPRLYQKIRGYKINERWLPERNKTRTKLNKVE